MDGRGQPIPWKRGTLIQHGGHSSVFICTEHSTGTLWAVKEIIIRSSKRNIERECEILRELVHPNVVQYIGVEVHNTRAFIFMEYCDKGSLLDFLQSLPEGHLSNSQAGDFAAQLLQALIYLHARQIVHCDLKCANLLLSGSKPTLKVGDFGVAEIVEPASVVSQPKGTVPFMSPEIVRPGARMDDKVDIWSTGCVVLEMLGALKVQCLRSNQTSQVYAHRQFLRRGGPAIPPTLHTDAHDFVSQCLAFDQTARPSALELSSRPFVARYIPQDTLSPLKPLTAHDPQR